MPNPLPAFDLAQHRAFWAQAQRAGVVPVGAPLPVLVGPFGDSVELADELLALVRSGRKTATVCALAEVEQGRQVMPVEGGLSLATDGSGRARAVLLTTQVRVAPFSSVDEAFAFDEGEGDRSLAFWRSAHEAYFRRTLPALGVDFHDALPLVFERFELRFAA